MIEINLLPEDMRKREPVKLAMPEIPIKKTLMASLAVVIVFQALLLIVALGLRLRVHWLEGEIAGLQKSGAALSAQKSETLILQGRLKELRAATSRKLYWSKLLDALTASVTRGVWLRSLSLRTEEAPAAPEASEKKSGSSARAAKPVPAKLLALEGSAIGAGQETAFIGKFLQSLKDNPTFREIFSDIQVSDIQQRRIEQVDAYDFLILCRFRKEKS